MGQASGHKVELNARVKHAADLLADLHSPRGIQQSAHREHCCLVPEINEVSLRSPPWFRFRFVSALRGPLCAGEAYTKKHGSPQNFLRCC